MLTNRKFDFFSTQISNLISSSIKSKTFTTYFYKGLLGVCPGEERHLVVPADLAYGDRGAGDVIPPDATLLFDIVVMDVEQVPRYVILLIY